MPMSLADSPTSFQAFEASAAPRDDWTALSSVLLVASIVSMWPYEALDCICSVVEHPDGRQAVFDFGKVRRFPKAVQVLPGTSQC